MVTEQQSLFDDVPVEPETLPPLGVLPREQDYPDANAFYKALYLETFPILQDEIDRLQKLATDAFNKECDAEIKRLRGPGKKKKGADDPVPSGEFYAALREKVLAEFPAQKRMDEAKALRQAKTDMLYATAARVTFSPAGDEMRKIDSSMDASYATQGYGASKYARGSLAPLTDKLERLGLKTEIRDELLWKNPKPGPFDVDASCVHELWANREPWLADAMNRTITAKEALASWRKRSLNARVYWPLLDPNIDIWSDQ